MAPVQLAGGVQFAPVGLTNMMNAGGAVLDFQLQHGPGGSNGSGGSGPSVTVQVLGCFTLLRRVAAP